MCEQGVVNVEPDKEMEKITARVKKFGTRKEPLMLLLSAEEYVRVELLKETEAVEKKQME